MTFVVCIVPNDLVRRYKIIPKYLDTTTYTITWSCSYAFLTWTALVNTSSSFLSENFEVFIYERTTKTKKSPLSISPGVQHSARFLPFFSRYSRLIPHLPPRLHVLTPAYSHLLPLMLMHKYRRQNDKSPALFPPSPVAIIKVLKSQLPFRFLLRLFTPDIIKHALQVLHQPHSSQLVLLVVIVCEWLCYEWAIRHRAKFISNTIRWFWLKTAVSSSTAAHYAGY